MAGPEELDVDERAIAAGTITETKRRELRRRLANADGPVVTRRYSSRVVATISAS